MSLLAINGVDSARFLCRELQMKRRKYRSPSLTQPQRDPPDTFKHRCISTTGLQYVVNTHSTFLTYAATVASLGISTHHGDVRVRVGTTVENRIWSGLAMFCD